LADVALAFAGCHADDVPPDLLRPALKVVDRERRACGSIAYHEDLRR
jgi:hypothetical protein